MSNKNAISQIPVLPPIFGNFHTPLRENGIPNFHLIRIIQRCSQILAPFARTPKTWIDLIVLLLCAIETEVSSSLDDDPFKILTRLTAMDSKAKFWKNYTSRDPEEFLQPLDDDWIHLQDCIQQRLQTGSWFDDPEPPALQYASLIWNLIQLESPYFQDPNYNSRAPYQEPKK